MTNSVRPQRQQPSRIRYRSDRGYFESPKAIYRPGERPHAAPPFQPWSALRLPTIGNGISLLLVFLAIIGHGPYIESITQYSSLTRLCLFFAGSILTFTIHTYLAFLSRSPSAGELSSLILVMISGPISLYVLFTIFAEWRYLVAGLI